MNVVILHNSPAQDALADESDVLAQVDAVHQALLQLGHDVSLLPCDMDLGAALSSLRARPCDVVFNLVESLSGTDRMAPVVPLMLDAFHIPYTGTTTWPLHEACGKLTTKRRLRATGLPTAPWIEGPAGRPRGRSPEAAAAARLVIPGRLIAKPVWEHASFGMDASSVFDADDAQSVLDRLERREASTGRPWFAEQFIEGREFNLSVLQSEDRPEGCQVLAPAEILFVDFPDDQPHIVGHRAKWDDQSIEYQRTPRRFDFPDSDHDLVQAMETLAERCWTCFGLSGYARVDFRVDRDNQPWILEVNANPCLTPDAGLAAAAARSGIDYHQLIGRIVDSANPTGG